MKAVLAIVGLLAASGCVVVYAPKAERVAACLAVWRDGRWRVGRFDDCSEARNTREKKNIVNGYLKGIRPVVGEPLRFLLVNADGKYGTKAPGGLWTQ